MQQEQLTWLQAKGVMLNTDKCEFSKTSLKYPWIWVIVEQIPRKQLPLPNDPPPPKQKAANWFIGMVNQLRQFLTKRRPGCGVQHKKIQMCQRGTNEANYTHPMWPQHIHKGFSITQSCDSTTNLKRRHWPRLGAVNSCGLHSQHITIHTEKSEQTTVYIGTVRRCTNNTIREPITCSYHLI